MNKEKFIELFKETLEIEDFDVKMEDNFRDYEEWDSLAVLSLLAMINEEFNILLKREELDKLTTIKELYEFISEKED